MRISAFPIIPVFLCSALLAGCQSTSPDNAGPSASTQPGAQSAPEGPLTTGPGIDRPGTFTRVRSPDPDKWVGARTGPRSWVFRCRPLACPTAAVVEITNIQSPTRRPDKQALEKYVKSTIVEELREKTKDGPGEKDTWATIKIANNRVTTLRGFPALHYEYEAQRKSGPNYYIVYNRIFAGATLIIVRSNSDDRELARANAQAFVRAMDITDIAPPSEVTRDGRTVRSAADSGGANSLARAILNAPQ